MLKLNSIAAACCVALLSLPSVLATQVIEERARKKDQPIANVAVKKWPAIIALILFFVSGTIHWIHFYRMGRKFMLVLPIAMYCMVFGFIMRLVFSGNNTSMGLYIITTLFVLLSPCAFLATDYVLLQQLSLAMGEDIAGKCLFLRSRLIVKIFVWSDVATFLVQACGGGMQAIPNAKTADTGSKIATAGLCLQLASFALFTALLLIFGYNVKTKYPEAWYIGSRSSFPSFKGLSLWSREPIKDWRLLFVIMCFTCIGILVRCSFRIAEYIQGYNGFLQLHEGYFYLLDALPLWLSMSLYCFLWPTRLIAKDGIAASNSDAPSVDDIEKKSRDNVAMSEM